MCYVKGDDILISVEEKTDKVKYEYLRAYYTLWNSITHPEHRVIVDLYAGTGHVIYKKNNGTTSTIYGSPLQAILRTIAKPQNLTIILNEIAEPRFKYLETLISEVKARGLPLFEKNIQRSTPYHAIDNPKRAVRIRNDPPEKRYPDVVGAKPPRGFIEKKNENQGRDHSP